MQKLDEHPNLVQLSRAEQALAAARDLPEIKKIIDIAEAARVYAHAAHLGGRAALHAETIKLKAQRKAGECLSRLEKNRGGDRKSTRQPVGLISDYRAALEETDVDERAAQRWQEVAAVPQEDFDAYIASKHEAPDGEISSAELLRKARTGIHFSSDSEEWYTPPEIIERALKALGVIDLDPCSDANGNVPAKHRFNKEQDGLAKRWHGSVYMNPPYGLEIDRWVEKLCAEFSTANVKQAIALVPARTDTDWFRRFRDSAVCFIDGRLKFSGHENSAPFPSAVVYLGRNRDTFQEAFLDLGDVWVRLR